jgi:hypothetical protein
LQDIHSAVEEPVHFGACNIVMDCEEADNISLIIQNWTIRSSDIDHAAVFGFIDQFAGYGIFG